MTKVGELHERWMKDPQYRRDYEALEEEFQLARTLIEARTRAGLSQTELAKRMNTSQSYMARLESGLVKPSTAALARFAHATGCKLRITFEPMKTTAAASKASTVTSKTSKGSGRAVRLAPSRKGKAAKKR